MSAASNCASFVSKLEPTCRTSEDRSLAESFPVAPSLDPELCMKVNPADLTENLRRIRNACGAGADGAEAARVVIRSKVIDYIAAYTCALSRYQLMSLITAEVSKTTLLDAGESKDDLKKFATVVLIGTQVLSNVIVALKESEACRYVWNALYPESISAMLDIGTRFNSRNTLAATMALLCNIFTFESKDDDFAHIREFVTNRSVASKVLWAIPRQEVIRPGANVDKITAVDMSADPVLEWFHILLYRVALRASLYELFTTLNPRKSESSVWANDAQIISEHEMQHFTHEQVVLLHGVHGCLEDRDLVADMNRCADGTNPIEDLQALLCCISATAMRSLLHFAARNAESPPSVPESVALIKSLRDKDDATWSNYLQEFPLQLVFSVISYGLSFCMDLSSHAHFTSQCKAALVDVGLVTLSIACVSPRPSMEVLSKRRQTKSSGDGVSSNGALDIVSERGLVTKEALSCLANLLYRCLPAQDALRGIDGIPIVLENCVTNFENPLLREWALLCVRNACDGCVANIEFINSLQLQNVVQSEELTEAGIRIELDSATGKLKCTTPPGSATASTAKSGGSIG